MTAIHDSRKRLLGLLRCHVTRKVVGSAAMKTYTLGLLAAFACTVSLFVGAPAKAARTCAALDKVVGTARDAVPAFKACLEKTPSHGSLSLTSGNYRIRSALVIDRPITVSSVSLIPNSAACKPGGDARCATLTIDYSMASFPRGAMPITVTAQNVTLSHLTVRGSGSATSDFTQKACTEVGDRARAGILRVSGPRFVMIGSAILGAQCYTGMEIVATAKSPRIQDNSFGPNGVHDTPFHWADGVTIHDTEKAIITGNRFTDNTDVQLITGGCRSCSIARNVFRHSGEASGASFAELMIHGWPDTSGQYAGTVVRDNDVDCGVQRRCGFGIMIGAKPWYQGPTAGGAVRNNRIRNAKLGLNIDGLSGPMEIDGNSVTVSGGSYQSRCGTKRWPATNVAPSSQSFVRGTQSYSGGFDTAGCIIP